MREKKAFEYLNALVNHGEYVEPILIFHLKGEKYSICYSQPSRKEDYKFLVYKKEDNRWKEIDSCDPRDNSSVQEMYRTYLKKARKKECMLVLN